MFDKSQVSCNCFGANNTTQQKFFLARKREPQESQQPQSVRRVIKSTEMKNQIQGKGQKKSLKKRPGSFVHSDNNYPISNEPNKVQTEIKTNLSPELPLKNKYSWLKQVQTPTLSHINPLIMRFPQTATSARQTTFINHPKQFIPTRLNTFNYIQYNPVHPGSSQIYRNSAQLRPQLMQFQNHKTIHVINQKTSVQRTKKVESRPLLSTQQISQNKCLSHPTPYFSQKNIRVQTQNWTPPIQDPLLIDDFQRLFKNKEDKIQNTKEKNALKPREAQQSKRFQQQQLMGRFAQSQNQEGSQSSQSQVIGKGFDRTYQDLLDQDEPLVVQQTKASRSTNTKVSNLRGQKHVGQHQRTKFGNLAHFTSYDRL